MTVSLRRAQVSDCESLSDLSFRSKASNGYDAVFMEACRLELTVTDVAVTDGNLWLTENGGKPVGFFDIRLESQTVEVYALYIDPDLKRCGIGRKLWAVIEEKALAMGAVAIELDADPVAVEFYKAMGCRVIGQSPSGSIPGRMLPRMKKWL